jgi:hypothetical protein
LALYLLLLLLMKVHYDALVGDLWCLQVTIQSVASRQGILR